MRLAITIGDPGETAYSVPVRTWDRRDAPVQWDLVNDISHTRLDRLSAVMLARAILEIAEPWEGGEHAAEACLDVSG